MSAGKGDSPRSCFSREYRENWDGIFRKSSGEGRRNGCEATAGQATSKASKVLKKRNETLNAGRTVSPHP
jgi:stress response protein YsnF